MPRIKAKPHLRSSVMRRKVEAKPAGVNVKSETTARSRTKPLALSGNAAKPRPKADRRVVRTRNALGDALVALMQEKPFEEITVQHVLDRARVGRSTFYEHYRGKDDLFISDVDEFGEQMANLLSKRRENSNRVAPVREMFSHVASAAKFRPALISSGKFQDAIELLQSHFARGIERRLSELPPARRIKPDERAAIAHAFAGSMVSLMTWWINRHTSASAEQMDELFHRLVWSGVGDRAPR